MDRQYSSGGDVLAKRLVSEPHPFFVDRPPLLDLERLEHIQEAMLRLLEQVGIAIRDERLVRQLQSRGFPADGNRIRIPQDIVSEYLEVERRRNGDEFSEEPLPIDPSTHQIRVGPSPYPQWVHDIESDEIVPFDTDRLIEATKLLHVLEIPGVPGCPADVPAPLQPVVQYWVSATHSRHGRGRVDPKSRETLPYIMEMGQVLGDPLESLPVYVFSPLTLAGESLRCALQFRHGLTSVRVSSMPSVGCTAPISVGDAYALTVAEVVGSAILLEEILDLPVDWAIRLLPADLRCLMMVLGSPESFLFQLATAEVSAFFHGTRWAPAAANIHTNAKLPGAQSCVEKASSMTAAALLGARELRPVGTLSLDEVFSSEQLVYDLEIKAHVERLVQGISVDCDPQRCVEDVKQGIQQKSFVGLDSTVGAYRSLYWHPGLFERSSLATWNGAGAGRDRAKARERVQGLLSEYDYRLEPELQRELDGILARAKSELVA